MRWIPKSPGVRLRLLVWLNLIAAGCRCAEEGTNEAPAPTFDRAPEQAPRCSDPARRSFLVESPGDKVEADDTDAPFSVELGRAQLHDSHFVVPFLRGDSRSTSAELLRLSATSQGLTSKVIELGRVHSAVAAPKVVPAGNELLLALADNDASGGEYRVGRVTWAEQGGNVRWLGEVDERGDDSPAFDLAAAGEHWLLAWDDWDRKLGKGVIEVIASTTERPLDPSAVRRVTGPATDAQSPRVLVRPGGYWLVWIALGQARPSTDDEAPLLATEAWLELQRLDTDGQPESGILELTPRDGHITSYDVVAAHDGRLLLAVRDDGGGDEYEAARIGVIRVGLDASVQQEVIPAPDLGASAPSLLFDPNPGGGAPHGWLALASAQGATTLAGLTPWGAPLEELAPDPSLSGAGVLAALGGELLVARPRGRDLELGLVRCRVGSPAAGGSASAVIAPGGAEPEASPGAESPVEP